MHPRRLAEGRHPDGSDEDAIRARVAERCDPQADDIPQIPPEPIRRTALTCVAAYERITGRASEPPPPAPPRTSG